MHSAIMVVHRLSHGEMTLNEIRLISKHAVIKGFKFIDNQAVIAGHKFRKKVIMI